MAPDPYIPGWEQGHCVLLCLDLVSLLPMVYIHLVSYMYIAVSTVSGKKVGRAGYNAPAMVIPKADYNIC